MKGIILAGGTGTRLYPGNLAVSKQLLPIYDKPMFYYPLSVLMLTGIREILVISTPDDLPKFKKVLKDGSQLGLNFTYSIQKKPQGIAQALIIGQDFIGKDPVCLILGDDIIYGDNLQSILKRAARIKKGALIFAYRVENPKQYGIVTFDKNGRALTIEEKPLHSQSNYAVPGIYFYDHQVVDIAKSLKPSARNELKITDVNQKYLKQGQLKVVKLDGNIVWLDTGTPERMLAASNLVAAVEKEQQIKIGCIEEIAYNSGFMTIKQLNTLVKQIPRSGYREYLSKLIEGKDLCK